jgi:hypothetical protein
MSVTTLFATRLRLAYPLELSLVSSTTEREVRAILREERKRCFDGEKLGEQVALEVRRVGAIALI